MSLLDYLQSDELVGWLPPLVALLDFLLLITFIPWILMTKSDSTSATAWCLLLLLLPFLGALLFLLFGYQHVGRPLRRKRRHKARYDVPAQLLQSETDDATAAPPPPHGRGDQVPEDDLARLAQRFDGFPVTAGNKVTLYHEGESAYRAMLEAIRRARHHVHMETFIFQPDHAGQEFLDAFTTRARHGVKVRLLYDAMGSLRLHRHSLRAFRAAGGRVYAFLPINPFRRRLQVNLRNHRKILVVDGTVAFLGGLNVGDEYLGQVPRFGFWRDTHVRLEGPAVRYLQRVFAEDWDFAAQEHLRDGPSAEPGHSYFHSGPGGGNVRVQLIESGPDRDMKAIREIYFAAILGARERLWIASPYFVPDAGLRDALRLAGYRGVDVRYLGQCYPDKLIPHYAARYYWDEMLAAGVKVFQYTRGMMHSKVVLVDGQWASVGTANLDIRSLHLNFEVNALFYDRGVVAELEAAFARDLGDAIRLEREVYSRRPFSSRLLENACRLLSPVL